jgi:hypothetical protein
MAGPNRQATSVAQNSNLVNTVDGILIVFWVFHLKDWQEKNIPDHGFLNCECEMPEWIWFPPKGNERQSIELSCKIELSFYELVFITDLTFL